MTNEYFKLTDKHKEDINKVMGRLTKKNISLNFDEIDSFDFPQDEPFGLQVTYNDIIYCFIIKFSSKNKNLICAGPGAHLRDMTLKNGEPSIPPFFDRWSWFKYFNESFIAYADPMIMFDDNVRIAWFVGDKKEWYLENLALILKELTKNQKIINDNILFFGSSGGGHSSIVLGTLIKNSKVIVNHPQIFVLNYYDGIVNHLFRMLGNAFEDMSKEEIIQEIKYRIDLIEFFKKENHIPFITYYVNIKSNIDVENQLLPFLEEVYKLKQFNGLNIIYYSELKENPHNTLLTRKHIDILYRFCENHLYNYPQENEDIEDENVIIKEKTAAVLAYENDEIKKQYESVLNSSSWKLTAPLRKLVHKMKKK